MAAHEAGAATALFAWLCLLPAVAAQCSLGLNFQPPGAPNVPYSWTVLGQAALKPAGNNDTGRIATVRLAAAPMPVLHVLPSHPLVGAVSSCVADCLPPPSPPARRLMQADGEAQASDSVEVPQELVLDMPLESTIAPELQSDPVFDAEGAALKPEGASASESEAGQDAGDSDVLSLEAAAGPSQAAPAGAAKEPAPAAAPKPAPAPAPGPAPAKGPSAAPTPAKAPAAPAAAAVAAAAGAKAAPKKKCAKSTDPGTLLEAGSWSLSWSLDGGAPVRAGPFQGSKPAEIRLDALADLPKGQHNLSMTVTLLAESASVSGAGALPAGNVTKTQAVSFLLVDASEAPDPTSTTKSAGPAADSVASKYWCALGFNVGGAIVRNKTVERVPEDGPLSSGAFQCARECNKMGPTCSAFGVVGAVCYLMSKVNTTSGGADSLVTALCMKNVQDWTALGAAHGVAAARDRYYCLPTFDVQGGPAGQPDDAAGGAKAPVTDFPLNSDPLVCAASCSATPGCEYFVQVKPAGCYLKSRPFDSDGRFGTTGPNPSVDVSCFRGEDAWLRAGSVLDAALPQLRPGLAGGVLTGSVAGAVGLVGNATAATYYCAREYAVDGTVHSKTSVGEGEPGIVACAAVCDLAGAQCAAHMTGANGTCTVFSRYALNTSRPDADADALCFRTAKEWDEFGRGERGSYCLKRYEIAGDSISTRDVVTLAAPTAAGSGMIQFCQSACAVTADCEFSVTQGDKCYLKNNIGGGTYGKTGASPATDAVCVKGPQAWLRAALLVSNQPPTGPAGPAAALGPGGTPLPRRNVTLSRSATGGRSAGAAGAVLLAAAALAALALA